MSDLTFNTPAGSVIDRCLLIAYLNTGTDSAPVWSAVGKRVEDSSMEYDWGDESKNDILGKTYTTMKKPTITQSFDPCELDSEDVAQQKIWNMAVKEQNTAALTNQDMLIAHFYVDKEGDVKKQFAERYKSCAVKPTGLGGSSNIGMPIDVTYGGTRTLGSVSKVDDVVTFTEDAA